MSGPEPSLRVQLLAAQADLRRQIEILQAGPASLGAGAGFIDNGDAVRELSATLREIKDGLANLGPGDR